MPRKDPNEDEDLDTQLLGVIGVTQSSKKDKKKKKQKKKKSKKRKSRDESSEEESSFSSEDSIESQKEEPAPKAKPIKKRKVNSDGEEEVVDSSGSEVDEWDKDLRGDESDRQYLNSLSEIQREAILAERYQRRKELQERKALRRKLKHKDDLERRTSKRSKVKDKSSAFDDLKKRRAKISAEYSSSSQDEVDKYSSEEEFAVKEKHAKRDEISKPREQQKREEVPDLISHIEANKISLRRDFLEQHAETPKLVDWLPGFFVRVILGQVEGKPVYRLVQIHEVREGKWYNLGKKKVNTYLFVRHGTSSKVFSIESVSNHSVTESEFGKWLHEVKSAGMDVMTMTEVAQKKETLREMKNYVLTDKDIQIIVDKKKSFQNTGSTATKRVELINVRDACKDAGDTEGAEKAQREIDKIDLASQNEVKADRQALINQRNQRKNQMRTYEEADQDLIPSELDPFHRRKTKPTNLVFFQPEQVAEEEKIEEKVEEKVEEKPEEKPVVVEEESPATFTEPQEDPEKLLKQAHNFELDLSAEMAPVEIGTDSNRVPFLTKEKEKKDKENKAKRPAISLTDYKRRRGLL